MKAAVIAVLAAALWMNAVGCDWASSAPLLDGVEKMLVTEKGTGAGDATMTQIRQQDQLRDGTGTDCPNPGTAGTGSQTGSGTQSRLRDGSCVN